MATDTRSAQYEGLFLLSQASSVDLGEAAQGIKDLLAKHGAEIISIKKWDERRLAYEIAKQKRGLYFLVYFTAPVLSLAGLERDCNLSETVLRQLVIRADHLTLEEMQAADAPQEVAEPEAAARS